MIFILNSFLCTKAVTTHKILHHTQRLHQLMHYTSVTLTSQHAQPYYWGDKFKIFLFLKFETHSSKPSN